MPTDTPPIMAQDQQQENPVPKEMAEAMAQLKGLASARRQKTWDELTPDEKIEQLRNVLRSKELAIATLQDQVNALSQHRHDTQTGQLMAPLYLNGGPMQLGGRGYDPLA